MAILIVLLPILLVAVMNRHHHHSIWSSEFTRMEADVLDVLRAEVKEAQHY